MPRRLFSKPTVTAGEWLYLLERYGEPDAADRRDRIVLTLKRLVAAGKPLPSIQQALMLGVDLWEQHERQMKTRAGIRRHNAAVAHAHRDLARAVASLRRLLPHEFSDPKHWLFIDDAQVLEHRERILVSVDVKPGGKGGRPWHWKQAADEGLKRAGVSATDRRELLNAFGFVEAE